MDSWIGGDIAGLQQMSDSLARALPDLRGSVRALSADVDSLVGDARWRGDAAQSFRATWTNDAITASGLADIVSLFSTTLSSLSTALNALDRQLQDAAHEARQRGVALGDRGRLAATVIGGTPAQISALVQATTDYGLIYEAFVNQAAQAREAAADVLGPLSDDISPTGRRSSTLGEQLTEADYVRGLWAVNAEGVRTAEADVEAAQDAKDAAYRRMQDQKAALRAAGQKVSRSFRTSDFKEARADLRANERALEAASNRMALPLDNALNYKLSDALSDAGRLLPDSATMARAEQLPEFLREIPVIDIAAVAAVGGFEARDDHDKGWSWTHSLAVDGAAVGTGLVAGVIVAASIPVVVEATGVTVGAVGTVALQGVAIVGVGTFADKVFHEHWSEDIHDHGVAAGLAHGAGHALTETGTSMEHLGESMWHGAKKVLGFL